ncbi:MAG: hypothetical protein JWN29_3583, partial [Acidimicrobiales bacterium]|nr:hypothetical protein [Acidimicrobiales bacterium]
AARGGESQQLPDEAAKALSEWQDVMKVERYLDLPQPWLTKA